MTSAHRCSTSPASSLPFVGFARGVVLLWDTLVDWSALAVMAVMYVLTGSGVTLGFHRLLTHRSFQTYKPVEYALAIVGSMAVQGPVMSWVADHRKHHAHTDQEGDPHSPHGHGSGSGARSPASGTRTWAGCSSASGQAEHARYARDLYEDRGMRLIHRTFRLWVLLGLADPGRARLRDRRHAGAAR